MRGKPFAITLDVGSSLANKTGAWRVDRPVYVERLAPCGNACPAGEDVQGWLFLAEAGDLEGAWRRIMEVNPLPGVMGRACFRTCETACNRAQIDEAVGINAVERHLADVALTAGWTVPVSEPTRPERVLVVGAGPAGLSAAYQLRRRGYQVTICDAAERPGGMLRYGIPAYRLPREVVDAEVARIVAMGCELQLNHRVQDLAAEMEEGGYDACFVAVGAERGRNPEIPAGDASRVVDAVTVLHGLGDDEPVALGRRVVVYGGGDTAIDAARSAQRLGATEAILVYRRTRDKMPAHEEEVEDALAEGVQMRWLSTVAGVEGEQLQIEQMALDANGQLVGTGVFEALPADALVLALGQEADLSLLDHADGVVAAQGLIEVDDRGRTGRAGIYAGGDATEGNRTVTQAVGDGRRAAEAIDAYLRGAEPPVDEQRPLATFDRLNPWYYDDAPRMVRPRLEAARRTTSFDEVVGGLTDDEAGFESRRCLSCGNCFSCDNCFGVCPDNAVRKLEGGGYEIDLDYCKGCGLCVAECPCGAIDLVPERR